MNKVSRINYTFPLIEEVRIKNFSLYKKANDIQIHVKNGVFCLAGANGLGKSTFLNILNFALTGVVLNPDKDFSSIVSTSKFYSLNKKFASTYFDGRIEEDDRERASVEIRFKIEDIEYVIERNFFEIDELLKYKRVINGSNTIEINLTPNELFDEYCNHLTNDIKLASFDQFVFLQHFLFTFDEHHHLLFWDKTLMETSLFLFFGLNVEDAQRANSLRKKINQLGSNIRNFTYQKNRTFSEVKELESKIEEIKKKKEENKDIIDNYENLQTKNDEIEDEINKKNRDLKHCDIQISDLSIKLNNIKSNYDKTFQELMSSEIDITKDENIWDLLKKLQNDIIKGGDGFLYYENIRDYIKNKVSHVKRKDDSLLTEQLSSLDKNLSTINNDIKKEQLKKERLLKEIEVSRKEQLKIKQQLLELDKEQSEFLKKLRASSSDDLTGLLKSYYEQVKNREDEIETLRNERIETQKQLSKLERSLSSNFAIAEEEFLPIFQSYVENFLGLDVSIKFKNSTSGSSLVLEINDSERIDIHQLSESQRYFVDIGLRMALIQFACNSSFLLVDTPEGSLDIAYESKAGQMFAEFAKSGHNLFITANINTSQLLIELAKACKKDKMVLERMTEWTYLSNVQIQEDKKIQEAFISIEESLN